ncbi:type II secretion system protein GspM, partial [Escherichia coli]|nr:type II secretion system protein GspM [Escherichia coli]
RLIEWMRIADRTSMPIRDRIERNTQLTQPIKNILLEEAKRENLAITLENGPDNTLTIHPVTAPLENVSRWLTTAQVTYGIVIEDLQFTLAGNEEITLRHLSFREQQ